MILHRSQRCLQLFEALRLASALFTPQCASQHPLSPTAKAPQPFRNQVAITQSSRSHSSKALLQAAGNLRKFQELPDFPLEIEYAIAPNLSLGLEGNSNFGGPD